MVRATVRVPFRPRKAYDLGAAEFPPSPRPETHLIDHESPFSVVPFAPGEDLVAVGGALDPEVVYDAYRHGVFPWYDAGQPVQWWCPDPRAILPMGALHVSRRLERTIRQARFRVTLNDCFERVMRTCGDLRGPPGWIHEEMVACYVALHGQGHAHSLEVWHERALVAGIYGVSIGGTFAAESMFHTERDMSKVALVLLERHLRARGFTLFDVQFETMHLQQFGCALIPREDYLGRLRANRDARVTFGAKLGTP